VFYKNKDDPTIFSGYSNGFESESEANLLVQSVQTSRPLPIGRKWFVKELDFDVEEPEG
jgi:hypothetical protein